MAESQRQLRALTDEIAQQIFAAVRENAVLVGGQSLAFWVSKYEIPIYEGYAAISMDADYLGGRDAVDKIGRCFHSIVTFPPKTAITALVGNVQIIPDDESYMNVDVIHKVIGLKAVTVQERSVDVMTEGILIRVMHPMHVLASRVINFYKLAEKQTNVGLMQVKLSIQVTCSYIIDVAHHMEGGQKAALKLIEEVVALAKTSAGRFAKLNGVDFLDAVPYRAISSENFQTIRLPRLIKELASTKPQKNRDPIAAE